MRHGIALYAMSQFRPGKGGWPVKEPQRWGSFYVVGPSEDLRLPDSFVTRQAIQVVGLTCSPPIGLRMVAHQ